MSTPIADPPPSPPRPRGPVLEHVPLGLVALVALAAAASRLQPLGWPDYWWHLGQGLSVLEHGARSYPDATAWPEGLVYTNPEWLFDLLLLGLHRLGGPPAAAVCVAIMTLVCVGLCWRLARAYGAQPWPATLITALATGALSWRLGPRPQLLFLVILPAVLLAARHLAQAKTVPAARRALGLCIGLGLVWSQVHTSVVLLPVLLTASLLHHPKARRRPARWLSLLLVAPIPLLSPFGLGIVHQVLGHSGGYATAFIADMQGMAAGWWWPPARGTIAWLELLLAGALTGTLLRVRAHPRDLLRRTPWALFGLALLGLAMTITAHRFRAAFAILLIPWTSVVWPAARSTVARGLAVLGSAAVATSILVASPPASLSAADPTLPVAATTALKGLDVRGTILTSYDQGGYIGWQLRARVRLLIDGRTPVFFDDDRFFAHQHAVQDPATFARVDHAVDFSTVLGRVGSPLCTALAANANWTPTWRDNRLVIFQRSESLTSQAALDSLDPCAPAGFAQACRTNADPGRWLSDLRRLSDLSPEDGWLQRLTVIIALDCATRPPSDLLVQLINRASQAEPDSADLPWLRARVDLATGDKDAAMQSLNQADPTDPRAARMAVALLQERDEAAAILDRLEPLHGEPDRTIPADLRCVEAKAALELGQRARAASEAIAGMVLGQEACREVAARLAAQGALSAEQQRWFDGL